MRVALYVRVSTQRQAQTQSLDQQLERLQRYATGFWCENGERLVNRSYESSRQGPFQSVQALSL